jgi:excisionase family DNA binding protein
MVPANRHLAEDAVKPKAEPSNKLAYSVKEFCAETGLGRDNAYLAIRQGKLRARKFGKRTLITADDVRCFLDGLPPLELPPAA